MRTDLRRRERKGHIHQISSVSNVAFIGGAQTMQQRYAIQYENNSEQFTVIDHQFGIRVVSRHRDEQSARRQADRAEQKWRFSINGLGRSEIYQMVCRRLGAKRRKLPMEHEVTEENGVSIVSFSGDVDPAFRL